MKAPSLTIGKAEDISSLSAGLSRILDAEKSKGYEDRAVIGGLDKYLRQWVGPARQTLADHYQLRQFQELFEQVDYASWEPAQRQEWLEKVLAWLAAWPGANPGPSPKTVIQARPRVQTTAGPAISLDSSLSSLHGLGPALVTRFEKLGVSTIRDLLYFFPHRHLDYSQIKPISGLEVGSEQTIIATVWEARPTRLGRQMGAEAILGDETGNIRAIWFNQPYLAKRFIPGAKLVLSGRVAVFQGMKQLESPEWELLEDKEITDLTHTGRLVPVYPLTQGLHQKRVRLLVKEAVERWAGEISEFLPSSVQERCHLLGLTQAISQAHYPDSGEAKETARRRLAFDELLTLQLGLLSRKRQWQESQPGPSLPPQPEVVKRFLAGLPFKLTPAQERSLKEILADLTQPQPMSRLLQGEVGSGKTVVATTALLVAVAGGYQGALMAPTELLAEQHFATLSKLLGTGIQEEASTVFTFSSPLPRTGRLGLLTGSLSPGQKEELRHLVRQGEIDILVGTHALIQKEVELPRLGLAVVDEQHRFGVRQRWELRQKGFNPHMLVMTATPIPRTLALTLYGDLDISVIDQLPPGRQEIKTRWLEPEQRGRAYAFLRKRVAEGEQAFIICPLIEESEVIEAKAATVEYERLSRSIFPDLKLGLLHGRLPEREKNKVMLRFRNRELDILVSTPVVEVGIDVPNATVMLVEGADRFGLSQLHQFRGRVGRGGKPSYCILVASSPSPEARERLALMERIRDGFQLAEEDLRRRGPGEFFGTLQSGLPELRLAQLSDVALLEMARGEARQLFQEDPNLARPEHRPLQQELARLWRGGGEGT